MTGIDDFAAGLERLESEQRWHTLFADDLRTEHRISVMVGVHDLGEIRRIEVEQHAGQPPHVSWSEKMPSGGKRRPATWLAVARAVAALDRASRRP